jgi:rhamnulose-1-phosphate aldolase
MYAESVIVNPGGIGFVPYILTGTTELAAASVSALRRHSVALWEKHGCIAAGNNLADLFDQIDVANKAATIYLLCSSAGIEPEGLTSGQMSGLKKKFG